MKLTQSIRDGAKDVSGNIGRATKMLNTKVAGAVLAGVMSTATPSVSAIPIVNTINTIPATTIDLLGASTGVVDIYKGGTVTLYTGNKTGLFQGIITLKSLTPENYTGYATLQLDHGGSTYQEILNVTKVDDILGVLSISFAGNLGSYGALIGSTYPTVTQQYSTASNNHIYVSNAPVVMTPVPEPSTLALTGAGILGIAAVGLRRKRKEKIDPSDVQ